MAKAPTGVADRTALPDVLANLGDFEAHLRAGNLSPLTIRSYSEAVHRLDVFLADLGMPRTVATIHRELGLTIGAYESFAHDSASGAIHPRLPRGEPNSW